MKKIILILLLFLGYNSNAQQNQHTLPNLYVEFQENLIGAEIMYKSGINSNRAIFTFESLLLGSSNLTDGVALEFTQIEGTIAVTIPLANLATYMAGRPLLNTIQIRQEYTLLTTEAQRVAYFNDADRDIFTVERNTTTQTAKITKVYWSNVE